MIQAVYLVDSTKQTARDDTEGNNPVMIQVCALDDARPVDELPAGSARKPA